MLEILRLPGLSAGLAHIYCGVHGLYYNLLNKNLLTTHPTSSSLEHLLFGLGLFIQASTMYISDSDPKLLEKKPFYKTAYNWLKEKTNSLVPKPAPQPTPVPISGKSVSLEECVSN